MVQPSNARSDSRPRLRSSRSTLPPRSRTSDHVARDADSTPIRPSATSVSRTIDAVRSIADALALGQETLGDPGPRHRQLIEPAAGQPAAQQPRVVRPLPGQVEADEVQRLVVRPGLERRGGERGELGQLDRDRRRRPAGGTATGRRAISPASSYRRHRPSPLAPDRHAGSPRCRRTSRASASSGRSGGPAGRWRIDVVLLRVEHELDLAPEQPEGDEELLVVRDGQRRSASAWSIRSGVRTWPRGAAATGATAARHPPA